MTSPSPVFRALIFDLDGTLSDSIEDIALAMNTALAGAGLPVHPLPAYRDFVGAGIENLVTRAAPPGADVAALIDGFRAAYRDGDYAHTRPYPGVAAMLEGLAQQGVRACVLSNKREDFTVELVRRQFPGYAFVDVRGERTGVARKPDPIAALELAQRLAMPVQDIGFVGDTAIDMRTARAAGMTAIGVTWGFRGRDELVEGGAQYLIDTPQRLLSLGPGDRLPG